MIIIEPHVRGLIFDCDGTLADTMPMHYLAWQETVAREGAAFPEPLFYELAGVPSDKIVTILNEKFGFTLDPQKIAILKEEKFLEKLPATQPIEVIVDIARAYKGKMPMAVATGGIPPITLPILKAIGLEGFFDAVVTAEDVVNGKPAPDVFLEAARRINIEPRFCQVFEDSDLGLEGAVKAGMVATDIRPWYNRHSS